MTAPTPKQLEVIRRYKIPTEHIDSRELATSVIDAIARNQWRRPTDEELAQLVVGEVPNDGFGDVDDHG